MNNPERIAIEIVEDPDALALLVASRIADLIRERTDQGKRAVLGLATPIDPRRRRCW